MRRISCVIPAILLAVVVTLGTSTTVFAQETINIGDTVLSAKGNSPKTYTVNVSAGTILSLLLESGAFDAIVSIQDADGIELGRNDDGGGGTNALLVLMLPKDEMVSIIVDSWNGAGGDFTLSVTEAPTTPLVYDTMTEMWFENENVKVFTFEGQAGDVVNIFAVSDSATLDMRLALLSPAGQIIAEDDDGGQDANPAIVRALLPMDGEYHVKLDVWWSNVPVTEDFTITIEETTLLTLDDGPITLTLSDESFKYDVIRFDATLHQRYRLTLTATESGAYVTAEIGYDFWEAPGITLHNALQGTLDFLAPETGQMDIILRSVDWDAVTVEIAIETVE
jgi:hypothetical protein